MEVNPGPCCPLPPGEVNMMSGIISSLLSTRFLSAQPDGGLGAVIVSTGRLSWEDGGGHTKHKFNTFFNEDFFFFFGHKNHNIVL